MREVRGLRNQGIVPANYSDDVLAQIKDTFKTTIVDAQGNFEFSDLPSGDYLLEVLIQWEVVGQWGPFTTGSMVSKVTTVIDGKISKIILTE